jgi:aspartate carbamoyltransferase regulatory subunit
MNINEIQDGYVIDHIHAGRAMRIYRYLELDKLDCSVAIIKNAKSERMGRKDIIKIDELIPLNLEAISSIDSGATVNTIQDGKLTNKQRLTVPERVKNALKCKNPRCITQTEQEIQHIFVLADREKLTYRCYYCDTIHKPED